MNDRLYVITDPIMFAPVRKKLRAENVRHVSGIDGIETFNASGVTFVVIDPKGFYASDAIATLRRECVGKSFVHVLAPSIIQYFVPKLDRTHVMYSAINELANHLVYVENPAVMQMSPVGTKGIDALLHRVSFSSLPRNQNDVVSGFITTSGQWVGKAKIANTHQAKEVAKPIIFQHTGMNRLMNNKFMEIVCDSEAGDAEQKALAFLAATFPSKTITSNLLVAITNALNAMKLSGLDCNAVKYVCEQNRLSWDSVRAKLKMVGIEIPPTPPDLSEPTSHDYSFVSLITSNFHEFAQRLNIELPPIRYVGLPVLARDGLTMTFGMNADGGYGIMDQKTIVKNFGSDVISNALKVMWQAIMTTEAVENKSKTVEMA
jgi:hypothetical protein